MFQDAWRKEEWHAPVRSENTFIVTKISIKL